MSATVREGAKRVGFLELFFDLVFVFAVTQLVSLLHVDHSGAGWARAAVMMWLIWWAWSQYAWTANAVDLGRRTTRCWVLAATGAMLVAAAAIPDAFGSDADGRVFAIPYVLVRAIGLLVYWIGLSGDRAQQVALRSYLPAQTASLLLVLGGGVLGGDARIGFWAAAIAVDVISVAAAGRAEFRVDPSHFAERHGLIVIIALGESVIALGSTATEVGLTLEVGIVLGVAFVAVAALWWCYFDWVHAAAEARLAGEPDHRQRSHLARDLFTLGHLPIVAGTVVFAAAIEETLVHPEDQLDAFGITALALGPGLYLVGFVIGHMRATGQLLRSRTVGLFVLVGAAVGAGNAVSASWALAAVALVVVTIASTESRARSVA